MNEADIFAGRAKSVSARHYALYELESSSETNDCLSLPATYFSKIRYSSYVDTVTPL